MGKGQVKVQSSYIKKVLVSNTLFKVFSLKRPNRELYYIYSKNNPSNRVESHSSTRFGGVFLVSI